MHDMIVCQVTRCERKSEHVGPSPFNLRAQQVVKTERHGYRFRCVEMDLDCEASPH